MWGMQKILKLRLFMKPFSCAFSHVIRKALPCGSAFPGRSSCFSFSARTGVFQLKRVIRGQGNHFARKHFYIVVGRGVFARVLRLGKIRYQH